VRIDRVEGDAENGGVLLLELVEVTLKIVRFDRAPGGEVLRI
jgi:hypothetical protein